jgi:threonine/homoserine/homoserine lactone efflux protein
MTDAIIAGLLLGLALVFSVGPVIFTIIKLRINYGIASAFYFIAGVWLSDLLWVVTANLFSELIRELLNYRKVIGSLGGIFLISLGLYYLFFKKYHPKEDSEGVKLKGSTHITLFVTGFLINTLNPGVIALWFGAATKAISYSINETLVTFSLCLGLNVTADIFKIKLAGRLKKKLTDKNIMLINRISGLLFVAFGVVLLLGVIYTSVKKS